MRIVPIQTKYSMIHNICSISGDWYEFGNVDGKILTAILASFGSVVILYLFFTPRKVNKPNNRQYVVFCLRYVISTMNDKFVFIPIGGKRTKNTLEPSMGCF